MMVVQLQGAAGGTRSLGPPRHTGPLPEVCRKRKTIPFSDEANLSYIEAEEGELETDEIENSRSVRFYSTFCVGVALQ